MVQVNGRHPIWTWTGFGLLLVLVFAFHLFPLTDTDIWWHLSAGRWMAEHHSIPRSDPFCMSSLGQPWVDAQWGFQILAFAAWKMGGSFALVLSKAFVAAAIMALLLFRSWNRRTMPFLFALCTYAAFHGRYLADMRPIWMTLWLLAWQYRLMRDWLDGRRALPWIFMLATQIAMVQMQGLHWLGPVQAGLLAVGQFGLDWKSSPARRTLALIGILPLCGLANPYGWDGWIFPLTLLQRITPTAGNIFSQEISENIPFWRWMSESPEMAYPFLVLAVFGLALWMATRPRRFNGEALMLAFYSALGLMAQRNLPLFLFGFVVIVSRCIPQWAEMKDGRVGWFRFAVLFCWAWTLAQTTSFALALRSARQWEMAGSWETPFRFPRGAVDYLQTHALRGVGFNEMRHGGYLGWHLFPDRRPFLDGRMVLHDGIFFREFLNAFDHPETFDAYRRKYGISWAVLPLGEGERPFALAAHLVRTGAMTTVFNDGAEILLTAPEAWWKGDGPIAWTSAQSDSAAQSRFGKNPRLLEKARQNLERWKSFSEVH